MRIIPKCPAGQGSGSPSPKGRARALAPSQSYRFVNNSHSLFSSSGRRPQIFPENSPILSEVGSVPGTRRPTAVDLRALPERSSRGRNRVIPSSCCSTDLRKLPGFISDSCKSPEDSNPASPISRYSGEVVPSEEVPETRWGSWIGQFATELLSGHLEQPFPPI